MCIADAVILLDDGASSDVLDRVIHGDSQASGALTI
jgi:hypothetical protein